MFVRFLCRVYRDLIRSLSDRYVVFISAATTRDPFTSKLVADCISVIVRSKSITPRESITSNCDFHTTDINEVMFLSELHKGYT